MTKKTPLNQHLEKQIKESLCQVLAETKRPDDIEKILTGLTSPAEFLELSKRLAVAVFLNKDRSYENISHNLGVNAATIASVAKNRGHRGVVNAVNMIEAEVWAENWTGTISRALKRILSL